MIGVVVLHYENPTGLDCVLTALDACAATAEFRVVVADDGSSVLPEPGTHPFPTEVVTQEDRGFRAAAARNLGARTLLSHEGIEALLFLDGDTVPTPGYVARMAGTLGRVRVDAPHGRALVVGRRRYADLTGRTPAEVAAFVATPDPARILTDPAWLEDGYADTANLTRADDRSYRFVISSVLALSPELFTALDGFDESFVGYGGEDWDLGNRAWLAGADLVHDPEALAWHDGPDAAGREGSARAADSTVADEQRRRKNAETCRVAEVVTEPGARDAGLLWDVPDVVVEIDDTDMDPAAALLTCADLVRSTDVRVWSTGRLLDSGLWPSSDPRVARGPVPEHHLDRCRYRVRVDRPLRLTAPLSELCTDAPVDLPGLTIHRTREANRGETPPPRTRHPHARSASSTDTSLEAEWGWRTPDRLPPLHHDDKEPT